MADIMSAYRIHSGGTWSQKYRDRGSPGQTNEAGWTVILNFWKVLNHHFNNVYESQIEQLIKSNSQELTKKSGCNSETGQSKEDPLVDYAGSRN